EPARCLIPRFLDLFRRDTVVELLHLFSSRVLGLPRHVGRLTPLLLDEALSGDSVAIRIVQEHGVMLGKYALAAARKVSIEGSAFTLVLAGGVCRHASQLLADTMLH